MNIVPEPEKRPMWQTSFHFFTLVLILVFANLGAPSGGDDASIWFHLWNFKWYSTGFFGLFLAWSLIYILKINWKWVLTALLVTAASAFLATFYIENAKLSPLIPMLVAIAALSILTLFDAKDEDNREWALSAWGFAKQILPLLAEIGRASCRERV